MLPPAVSDVFIRALLSAFLRRKDTSVCKSLLQTKIDKSKQIRQSPRLSDSQKSTSMTWGEKLQMTPALSFRLSLNAKARWECVAHGNRHGRRRVAESNFCLPREEARTPRLLAQVISSQYCNIYIFIYLSICLPTYLYTSLSLSLYVYIYIYIYMHTYIHTYCSPPKAESQAFARNMIF